MPITRREFTLATANVLALATIGCGKSEPAPPGQTPPAAQASKDKKAKVATEPFLAGPPAQFLKPNVYSQFVEAPQSKGVYLVSDGSQLIALVYACTHLGCAVEWTPAESAFLCPCHKSHFDNQGVNEEGAKAKRPLERCALTLIDTDAGKQIQVDPTQRFKTREQWSNEGASLALS